MRIAIIGATRGTGLALTEQAVNANHEVSVLVRRGTAPCAKAKNLRAVRGDVRDGHVVERTVQGSEAVIICLGIPPTLKPVTVFSTGTRNVVTAMYKWGIERLVVVTGIGCGDSKGHGGFAFDNLIQPTLLNTICRDKERQEKVVKESGLQWTIVRPGFLTNGNQTGSFQELTALTRVKKMGKISRKDVAYFLLRESADRRKYIEKTVHLMR